MVERGTGGVPLRLGVLCEGDPETRDAWSGIVQSVVTALRNQGHSVQGMDVELAGWRRWAGAAVTVAPGRRRWSVRYRLGAVPFLLRSGNARRQLARFRGQLDAVIQVGATFDSGPDLGVPLFLFCDSNIRMSEEGAQFGVTEARWLGRGFRNRIADREGGLYHRVAGIFTLSERARTSFLRQFDVAPDRVHTVHGGPNFDWGRDATPGTGRRNGSRTILFVGRDFERKGGEALLRAFETVRRRVTDAELVIIGPEPRNPAPAGVRYLGFLNKDLPADRERLVEAYEHAALFCLPTRFEPYGVVFIEAMHFGLPCVGSARWAIPEMVVEGETGFLVDPDDVGALADRVIRLLNDPALARRMGAAGLERARRQFTWDVVARKLVEVIRRGR